MGNKAVVAKHQSGRRCLVGLAIVALLAAVLPGTAVAQTLVASPFITSYDGWTDTYNYGVAPGRNNYPSWGVLLEKGVLLENSEGTTKLGGIGDGGLENDGLFKPYIMVNSVTTPSSYTITGTYSTWDDAGLGIIFGYQDENNYFRLGSQNRGTSADTTTPYARGFYQGLTVSKVVNGVITPYVVNPTTSFVNRINDARFCLKLKVDGDDFEVYAWRPDGGREPTTPQLAGSDPDLATMGQGKYGTMSYSNRFVDSNDRAWGAQLHSMTIDNGSNGTIDTTHTFTGASPLSWRPLAMTNAANVKITRNDYKGNFQLDFNHGVIQDDSNGYIMATATAPNADFIGPAVVVDDAGAQTLEDIEMKVRIACDDDEGPGLLFRVQNDNTFYRLNFASQSTGTGRPIQGVSIQKCVDNGVGVAPTWTQLAGWSSFIYTPGTSTVDPVPFDVKVTVTNDPGDTATTIDVSIINDPDGANAEYNYSVTDSTNPLLTGTVGFTNWGGAADSPCRLKYASGVMYSGYGGVSTTPLVVVPAAEGALGGVVPEPGTLVLLASATAALAALRRRIARRGVVALLLAASCMLAASAGVAQAATLIDTPFRVGYDGWTDTNTGTIYVGDALPQWGVLVSNDALCDGSDGALSNGGTAEDPTNGVAGDGKFRPWLMVNSNYTTPSQYTLVGRLSSADDAGMGLVFGYLNDNNYFRVVGRAQTTGSYGCAQGISIQKVVGGVITQLQTPSTVLAVPSDDTPLYLSIGVNGSAYSIDAGADPGLLTPIFSGSDPDLATLGPGKYGFLNWRNGEGDNAERFFGAQLHSLTVDEGSDGLVDRTHTFESVSPLPWRELYMTNATGGQITLEFDKGNFRHDFRNGTIVDDTNPFLDATATAPHTDYLGSAIAINDSGTLSLEDYQMQVRMECADDEGPGLLVRVQSDNTFYRVNFTAEPMGTGDIRPRQGMSIQKCDGRLGGNPVWTELLYEETDPFIYTNHNDVGETFPFDVKVTVTNNVDDTATTIRVEVIDDPEESATPYVWTVTDSSNPILTGTVGLTNWGAGNQIYGRTAGVIWSGYGGVVDAPLVVDAVAIPEIPGDANRDGSVNDADAAAVAAHWGTGTTWEEGDFNNDDTVNAIDAAILTANWGYVWGGGETAAVPEPGTMALLLGAMAAAAFARRRR